jgi:hypothetical protein
MTTQPAPVRSLLQILINSRYSEIDEGRHSYIPEVSQMLADWDEGQSSEAVSTDGYQEVISALVASDVTSGAKTSFSTFVKLLRTCLGTISEESDKSGTWAIKGEPWRDIPSASWPERALAFLLWSSSDFEQGVPRQLGGGAHGLAHRLAILGYTRLAKTVLRQHPEALRQPQKVSSSLPSFVKVAVHWDDTELLKTLLEHKFSHSAKEFKIRSTEALILLLGSGYKMNAWDISSTLGKHASEKQAAFVADLLLKNSGLSIERSLEDSFALANLGITVSYAAKLPAGLSARFVKDGWSASAPTFMLASHHAMDDKEHTLWFKKAIRLAKDTPESAMLAPGLSERTFLDVACKNALSFMDQPNKKIWASQLIGLNPKSVTSRMLSALIPSAIAAGPSQLRVIWAREMLTGFVRANNSQLKKGIVEPQVFSHIASLAKMELLQNPAQPHIAPHFDFEEIKWIRPSGQSPDPEDALWVMLLQIKNIGVFDEKKRPPAGFVKQVSKLVLPYEEHDQKILYMALDDKLWEDGDFHADWLKLRNSLKASLNQQKMDRAVTVARSSPALASARVRL